MDQRSATITTDERTPSDRVIAAIAEAEGKSVVDLDPLYDVVDPDALDELFAPTVGTDRTPEKVTFTYHGYEVDVYGDGTVTLDEGD